MSKNHLSNVKTRYMGIQVTEEGSIVHYFDYACAVCDAVGSMEVPLGWTGKIVCNEDEDADPEERCAAEYKIITMPSGKKVLRCINKSKIDNGDES